MNERPKHQHLKRRLDKRCLYTQTSFDQAIQLKRMHLPDQFILDLQQIDLMTHDKSQSPSK